MRATSVFKRANCGSSILNRFYMTSFDVMETTVRKHVVGKVIDSIGLDHILKENTRMSSTDPSKPLNWEWTEGLETEPKLSKQELRNLMSSSVDPFLLVENDISTLAGSIKLLLGSDHPVLASCAKYFFEIDGGKKIRPTMVLLMSYALNATETNSPTAKTVSGFASPSQKRLAEITEMIHTASLFHDDVIDKAETRRGAPSVNQVFGDKLAILGGDFLLSRASVALARLRNLDVVELLSLVIEHLVKGEVMQMRPPPPGSTLAAAASPELLHYLRKNFFKTASLMGNSCLAAAVLQGEPVGRCRAAYLYGVHVGHAFQLVDDALDFEGSLQTIGKAPLADLRSGLATAPTLFAAQEFPSELSPLIARKFEREGDVAAALSFVDRSAGLARTHALAQVHMEIAVEAVRSELCPSAARDALVALACKVVLRDK